MFRSVLDRARFAAVATGVFVLGVLLSQYVLTLRIEIAAFVVFVVLGQAVASALSYTAFTLPSKTTVLALAGEWPLVIAPLGAASLVTLGVGLYDRATGAIRTVHPAWVLVPAVVPLYSLAALKAVLESLTTWDGEWDSVTKGVE